MSKNNPFTTFPNFVLRTPLYPVNFLKQVTSKTTIPDQDFKSILNQGIVQEALFLASPPLYYELQKWLNDEIMDGKKEEKLKYSLLKYLSRMSSRCTPFGLFAGCAVGDFGEKTNLVLDNPKHNDRHTRLDMNYLVALSQNLAKNAIIREQLLFFPNTSIYKAGDQLRYVEYEYNNTQRQHHIIAVDNSDYLNTVLQAASNGLTRSGLIDLLIDDEITKEEATAFIEELVESQLLISELEPSVSGPEFLEQIIKVLSKISDVSDIISILKKVQTDLRDIDSNIGNPVYKYIGISEELKKLKTEFDLKYLFQTDMVVKPVAAILNTSVVEAVKKGLTLFNKITLPSKDTLLTRFKEAFYERFEEREIPLSTALDIEIGIGYKQNQRSGEVNPLIDDIILPPVNTNTAQDVKWSSVDSVIRKILFNAIAHKKHVITIKENDFEGFEENWSDLPDTISALVEIVNIDGVEKVKFSSVGGSGAGNLLGRFCHGDENLNKYTQQIIEFETKANPNKILAEIVHLPESRTGNILMRPSFRKFEIPYLAKSVLNQENQIPIKDLMVSVTNGDFISLKSKEHNKEVIPRLTNAHNYSANALPVYQFLCDMQTQNKRGFLGINLGPFANEYDFIPRIEYEDLILSEATWNLKKRDIEPLLKVMDSDQDFSLTLKEFKQEKRIPQFVLLTDGDNELLINFENLTSVRMLLHTVKKRTFFKLTEFLFSDNGLVKSTDGKEYYTHQIILSFYNSKSVKQ